jgi:hypothetical protein
VPAPLHLRDKHTAPPYGATQVLGICIAATATHFLARGVFWPDLFVHLGASAFVAIISYLINRLVIFRNHGSSDGS